LAEDNIVNQKLAVRLLEKQGHSAAVANNGREALKLLAGAGKDGFDLVLMDIQMPEMGGLEATAAIREREKATGRHIPIVAMTAHTMKGDRERCLAAGMNGYIAKPVQAEVLFREISAALSGSQPSSPAPQPPVDEGALLARVGGDKRLLTQLVKLFLTDCPRMMSKIDKAVNRGDAEGLRLAAHSLKGSVGNFAAPAAYEAARRLEEMAREGDLSHVQEAWLSLESEIIRLEPALASTLKSPGRKPRGASGRRASRRKR
jgi:CheY-like chemotaxis protein